MAQFVELDRDNSGNKLFVNLDNVCKVVDNKANIVVFFIDGKDERITPDSAVDLLRRTLQALQPK